ncbi:DHHC zinc finger domain-containing protein [Toxoplasma gondii TgCatPRC2]|uniref:DHHC zinc finger domain-containing protein n=2 Tax=Toxoplasma gondii TaxID=5811 RepID=A0A151HR07_TOXGO|nr:DHHC zinc finger domain-containing protein [Toxoplasma gondii MAS]KYK71768.1 DHHC zinc finger domain-containing protein [Toxoplasma gondii TgCatPRC2]
MSCRCRPREDSFICSRSRRLLTGFLRSMQKPSAATPLLFQKLSTEGLAKKGISSSLEGPGPADCGRGSRPSVCTPDETHKGERGFWVSRPRDSEDAEFVSVCVCVYAWLCEEDAFPFTWLRVFLSSLAFTFPLDVCLPQPSRRRAFAAGIAVSRDRNLEFSSSLFSFSPPPPFSCVTTCKCVLFGVSRFRERPSALDASVPSRDRFQGV